MKSKKSRPVAGSFITSWGPVFVVFCGLMCFPKHEILIEQSLLLFCLSVSYFSIIWFDPSVAKSSRTIKMTKILYHNCGQNAYMNVQLTKKKNLTNLDISRGKVHLKTVNFDSIVYCCLAQSDTV